MMTSPVNQADLKMSLLERVSRKLETKPQLGLISCQPEEKDVIGLMETNNVRLDKAFLVSRQDENENVQPTKKLSDGDCGDMEISHGSSIPPITTDNLHLPLDEPPREERLTIDDFDLPFDDEPKSRVSEVEHIVDKPPGKHKISLDDLQLPFEDADDKASPAHVMVPRQPKRARRRKKSADFEIITAQILISPDVELPNAPTYRRSSRLRRKSTELYKSRIQLGFPASVHKPAAAVQDAAGAQEHTAGAMEHAAGAMEHAVGAVEHAAGAVEHATGAMEHAAGAMEHATSAMEHAAGAMEHAAGAIEPAAGAVKPTAGDLVAPMCVSASGSSEDTAIVSLEMENCVAFPDQLQVSHPLDESIEDTKKHQQDPMEEEEENITPLQCSADNVNHADIPEDATRKERRKRKCTLSTKENDTTPKKTKTSPKLSPPPSIEDIYLNRLWRTQMPIEKTWETIHEEPKLKGKTKCSNKSGRPQRRVLDPDEFYTQTKLRRRRDKALKQGWKPLSKKRLQKAETLLFEKLAILDTDDNSMGSMETEAHTSLDNVTLKDLHINARVNVREDVPVQNINSKGT